MKAFVELGSKGCVYASMKVLISEGRNWSVKSKLSSSNISNCRISTEEIVVSLLSISWPFCHQRRFFCPCFCKMLYSSLSPCPWRSLCPRGVQIWEAKTKSKVYLHCSVIEKLIISCDFLVNFDKLNHCTASSVQGGRRSF